MSDNQNIKDRLLEYIKIRDISNAEFERRAGLSNAYMQNMRGNPTATTIEKILINIPELNRIWLLTGEGQMLNANLSKEISTPNKPINQNAQEMENDLARDYINTLKDQLAKVMALNEEQAAIIKELTRKDDGVLSRQLGAVKKRQDELTKE